MKSICIRRPALAVLITITALITFWNTARTQSGDPAETNHPGPRWGHVFVYDEARQNVLLFGGAKERGAYLDDTWAWDGDRWRKHEVSGPPARGFSAVTYDPDLKRVILHGGRGNDRVTYSDTWAWDGATWLLLDSASQFKADHHQITYLSGDSTILAFGGWTGDGVSARTWLWSDNRWLPVDAAGPPGRAAFAMAFDTRQKRVVLHGGLWIDGQYADMWAWQNGAWQVIGGPYDHSSIDHLAMVYDRSRQRMIAFGGKNYRRTAQPYTLHITDSLITQLSETGPGARHSIGMTYDSHRQVIILYGGKEYQGEQQLPLGDLWILDGAEWRQVEP